MGRGGEGLPSVRVRPMKIHKGRTDWNLPLESNGWTGGRWVVNNQSKGYHGILKQWWDDTAADNQKWLLVSENSEVKKEFQERLGF